MQILISQHGGGSQSLKPPNVELPIFLNFEIPNIKLTKVDLFYFFIYKFIYISTFFQIIRTLKIHIL